MGRLENKVALITGAAGGQGAEYARHFAREGCAVVVTDVEGESLADGVKDLQRGSTIEQ